MQAQTLKGWDMETWSGHRTTCRHRAGGDSLVLASLAVALLLPPTGVAYANDGEKADIAPAAMLLAGAADDSSGNSSDDTPVAHVVPQVFTVIENGPLSGYEFSFVLKDANNQELDEAINDANGNVSFSQLDFTAHDLDIDAETGKPGATTFTYYVSELSDDESRYVYDKGVIEMSVTVAPTDDGTLRADVAYARLDGNGNPQPIDEPTFTNRFVTVPIHHTFRSSIEPYDPLPGVHYGLWMVNPNGEDWYMGLGRNQQEVEGSRLESDDNGNLWWDVPVLSYVCYYFKEEWPPPAGHLVDPYPSEYFQLVFDEDNGYRTVYESDPEFLSPYGGMMGRNRTGEGTDSGDGPASDSPTSDKPVGDSPTSENPTGDSSANAGSTSGNPASGSTTSASPMSATTKAQQPTVAATSRTSTQMLPATSDTTGGNPTLAFAGALTLLVGSMRQRRA